MVSLCGPSLAQLSTVHLKLCYMYYNVLEVVFPLMYVLEVLDVQEVVAVAFVHVLLM